MVQAICSTPTKGNTNGAIYPAKCYPNFHHKANPSATEFESKKFKNINRGQGKLYNPAQNTK